MENVNEVKIMNTEIRPLEPPIEWVCDCEGECEGHPEPDLYDEYIDQKIDSGKF